MRSEVDLLITLGLYMRCNGAGSSGLWPAAAVNWQKRPLCFCIRWFPSALRFLLRFSKPRARGAPCVFLLALDDDGGAEGGIASSIQQRAEVEERVEHEHGAEAEGGGAGAAGFEGGRG